MYELNDTIVAVSSPTSAHRVIVRITGPDTVHKCRQIFSLPVAAGPALYHGRLVIDPELSVDAQLYLFLAPHSYTGQDVAEIHVYTNPSVIEALMGNLLGKGPGQPDAKSSLGTPLRMAGPGEFTARAYLSGKIDLAQAEAVNEIIVTSNKFQLAAAEKLLTGRLAQAIAQVRTQLMHCLSLIEAGLDFSGEDIEFVTCPQAVRTLYGAKSQLQKLLSGSISYEAVIDLPSVGIAGAPNAGKSTLLNKLLGTSRSIVSEQRKTTRDVLMGLLTLAHCRCVIFDCAGLMPNPHGILDELAQQAAIEALQKSWVVIFCIDVSKNDYREDMAIRNLIEAKVFIPAATKCDLLRNDTLTHRLAELNGQFQADFIPVSAKAGRNVERLQRAVDRRLIELALGDVTDSTRYEPPDARYQIALTARHRQAVTEAIESITESITELEAGNDEVAAMMLRAACQALSTIEQRNIDEEVLEQIFKHFCIGK